MAYTKNECDDKNAQHNIGFVEERLLYALHFDTHSRTRIFTLLKKRRRKTIENARLMVKFNERMNWDNRTFSAKFTIDFCVWQSIRHLVNNYFFFFFFLFSIEIFIQEIVVFSLIHFLTLHLSRGGRRTIPLCSFVIRRNDNSINKQWVLSHDSSVYTKRKWFCIVFALIQSVLGRFGRLTQLKSDFFTHFVGRRHTHTQVVPISLFFSLILGWKHCAPDPFRLDLFYDHRRAISKRKKKKKNTTITQLIKWKSEKIIIINTIARQHTRKWQRRLLWRRQQRLTTMMTTDDRNTQKQRWQMFPVKLNVVHSLTHSHAQTHTWKCRGFFSLCVFHSGCSFQSIIWLLLGTHRNRTKKK